MGARTRARVNVGKAYHVNKESDKIIFLKISVTEEATT